MCHPSPTANNDVVGDSHGLISLYGRVPNVYATEFTHHVACKSITYRNAPNIKKPCKLALKIETDAVLVILIYQICWVYRCVDVDASTASEVRFSLFVMTRV